MSAGSMVVNTNTQPGVYNKSQKELYMQSWYIYARCYTQKTCDQTFPNKFTQLINLPFYESIQKRFSKVVLTPLHSRVLSINPSRDWKVT